MRNVDLEKLEKRKDVIDMMVSMHSELSSMYRKHIIILDVLIVILSIILLTFVFGDQYLLNNNIINEIILKLILGSSTVFLTFLSLLSYIVNWRGKRACHDQAFIVLIDLKNEWRNFLFNKESINYDNATKLQEKTDLILKQCISIDDKLFNKLKIKHYTKVELSNAISDNPNLPLFLHKINLLKKAIIKNSKGKV